MDRVQQVERPGNTSTNQRQNDRKNSLPKISPRGEQRQVTAGGDASGKMPRGYRARKNVQSNADIKKTTVFNFSVFIKAIVVSQ